jgi:hypothetical protein
MASESFENMRKRVIREYKHLIVRSALQGHKNKGRGLVLVKCNQDGMVRLSYMTLDTLKDLRSNAGPEGQDYGAMLILKISAYHPDSEIPVMVTDGESERLSFGVRRGPNGLTPGRTCDAQS